MSTEDDAVGVVLSLKDNALIASVLTELVPFLPALKRMGLHYLLGFVANLQGHKWAEAYVKLARASRDDELDTLPKRAAALRVALAKLEAEHEKLVWDVLLRVGVALAVGVAL